MATEVGLSMEAYTGTSYNFYSGCLWPDNTFTIYPIVGVLG